MGNSLSPEDRLKELTEFVKDFHYQKRFILLGEKLGNSPTPFERLMYAQRAFLSGAIPDSTTLLYIAESIYRYASSKGEVTLDEAFKLKSTPAKGNPAAQYAHNNKLNSILFEMASLRAQNKLNHKRESLETVASLVSPEEDGFSIDTLVKYYKNNGWKKISDIMSRDGKLERGKLIF